VPLADLVREQGAWFAYQYAIDVLGARKFAPWLYVYTAISGAFRFGWIPANFYRSVVFAAIVH
jgi:hypothetical protein